MERHCYSFLFFSFICSSFILFYMRFSSLFALFGCVFVFLSVCVSVLAWTLLNSPGYLNSAYTLCCPARWSDRMRSSSCFSARRLLRISQAAPLVRPSLRVAFSQSSPNVPFLPGWVPEFQPWSRQESISVKSLLTPSKKQTCMRRMHSTCWLIVTNYTRAYFVHCAMILLAPLAEACITITVSWRITSPVL